jgi:VWFA-related protein
MSTNRYNSLILLAALAAPACGLAQAPASSAPQSTNKIVLDVVVSPKSGAPVANLQQQNFTLLDNKVQRPITSFRAVTQSQEPAEVILVIDNVNTPYQTIAYARPQIDKFLLANGGHLPYPTTLAVANDTGVELQGNPTTDGNALSAAFDKYEVGLKFLRHDTGIWGAAQRSDLGLHALNALMARERTRPGRKIVLWISPGWPLLSGPRIYLPYKQEQQLFGSIVGLSNQLRDTDTTLYAINPLGAGENVLFTSYYQDFLKGVSKPSQVALGDLSLQVLAAQSGGQVFYSSNDITGMLQKAMADTSAYYELTFDAAPGDHPDTFHQIDVQLNDRNLVARTRNGYYAQPPSTNAAVPPASGQ